MSVFQKVVIKVGTNVLTREDGLLDMTNISHLVDQVAHLKNKGIEVILVSSGAVGAGRATFKVPGGLSRVVQRQVLSAIGQVRLMEVYRQLFGNYQLYCAQVLATKEDFRDRQHYLNMRNCFDALLRDHVVPVVNENDVVAVTELMFTDNDELAGLVAAMTNADALIILSSVDGLLDGPPEKADSKVIPLIDPADPAWLEYILPSRSSFGRGGMHTKFRVAQKAAKVGIATFIANGRRVGILEDILAGQGISTCFQASDPLSNVKKWIAYNELGYKGKVFINEGAADVLLSQERVSSLLPVGIIRLEGTFEKGDLLSIYQENGERIGLGIAQYDSDTALAYLGQQGQKELVHYDYLVIDR
ncbi:MAG: glutamate 5-kinase [Saprospiraceae bacterium]|nr:MAG: glutamate 5-kinase [Saprospiraceae bacterium]